MISARLLGFCEALRKNGVRAAEQEVLDAFRALAVLGPDALVTREALYATLAATLAKSAAEEDTLARVFELHFGFALDPAPLLRLEDMLRARGLDDDAIAEVLRDLDADELAQALRDGDADRLTELVRNALEDTDVEGLQSSLQVAYFTARVLSRLQGDEGFEARMLRAGNGRAGVAGVAWDAAERLRRMARRAVELELEKRTVSRPAPRGSLLDRDLRAVDASEIAELRRLVRRLAQRLRERLVQRRKRARRGRVDVRRTLRRSVATDAVPMRISIVRRRPQRPEVIVLCDVSDSVRQASLFMLELVAALADVLRRARSFVFVDRVGEVTARFGSGSDREIDDAIAAVLRGDVVSVSANSDYGAALRAFWDTCGAALTRKTTVVILGDGRSNYRPAEDAILGDIKRRSRRLLWLCPEDRPTWGYGDSEMHRYARHADAIFVVRSAADLARAIDRIAR